MNELLFTPAQNSDSAATLVMHVEKPVFALFDQVSDMRGRSGIVIGVSLTIEPACCFWSYYLKGRGIESSVSHAGFELTPLEVGNLRKLRIKRPAFKLFDPAKLIDGQDGFISAVVLNGREWGYGVCGVGIDQGVRWFADEFKQPQQQAA